MNRPSSARSTINKTFSLFIVACLLLTIYGIYIYIQDSNDSSVPAPTQTPIGNIPAADTEESTGTEEEPPENFQVLDERVENDVKTNLSEEATRSPEEDIIKSTTAPITMSVSFSNYDQDKETLKIGLMFINDQEKIVSSCSLEITAHSEQITFQKSNIIGQRGISGCHFNNINLGDLPEPSQSAPWRIIVQGNNAVDQNLVSLERDVFSIMDLNNLINN